MMINKQCKSRKGNRKTKPSTFIENYGEGLDQKDIGGVYKCNVQN